MVGLSLGNWNYWARPADNNTATSAFVSERPTDASVVLLVTTTSNSQILIYVAVYIHMVPKGMNPHYFGDP